MDTSWFFAIALAIVYFGGMIALYAVMQ